MVYPPGWRKPRAIRAGLLRQGDIDRARALKRQDVMLRAVNARKAVATRRRQTPTAGLQCEARRRHSRKFATTIKRDYIKTSARNLTRERKRVKEQWPSILVDRKTWQRCVRYSSLVFHPAPGDDLYRPLHINMFHITTVVTVFQCPVDLPEWYFFLFTFLTVHQMVPTTAW